MTFPFLLTLAALGFVGAFVAGLLGVGGAILMIPLLLSVPPCPARSLTADTVPCIGGSA